MGPNHVLASVLEMSGNVKSVAHFFKVVTPRSPTAVINVIFNYKML